MKITLLTNKYLRHSGGGAQRSVQLLAETYAADGNEVTVLATAHKFPDQFETFTHNSVKIVYFPTESGTQGSGLKRQILSPFWHWRDSRNNRMGAMVLRYLRSHRPDVFHTNILSGFSSTVWRSASSLSIPVVHTVRDYYLMCGRSNLFKRGSRCKKQCLECKVLSIRKKWNEKYLSAAVGISDFIIRKHQEIGWFKDGLTIKVIGNPVPSHLDCSRNLSRNLTTIGYLGRLSPEKGIEDLLDAVHHTRRSDISLLLGGSGAESYESVLRERYIDRRIRFVGQVETFSFLREVDVLVVPSTWDEPFGRVIVEAHASGVPVIGTCRGAIPELIEPGVTGFLYEPGSGELISLISSMRLENLRSMREKCVRYSESLLPEKVASAYLQLYGKLISRQAKRNSLRA